MQGSACAHTNGPLPGTFDNGQDAWECISGRPWTSVHSVQGSATHLHSLQFTSIHFNSLQFIPIACNSGRNLHHKKLHEELSKNKR